MYVNDEIVDIQLKLGNAGEAFFVEETEDFVSPSQITSPIGSPPTSPAIFKRTTVSLFPTFYFFYEKTICFNLI